MNSQETPSSFVQRFTNHLICLQEQLSCGTSNIQEVSTEVKTLSVELTEWASNLPSYELRRCERELQVVMNTLKHSVAPKKKFGFTKTVTSLPSESKTTPKSSLLSSPPPLEAVKASSSHHNAPTVPTTSLTLSNRKDHYLPRSDLPKSTALTSEALLLDSLEGCFVDLSISKSDDSKLEFPAIYLYSLKDSVVFISPVKGSIMIHGCSNCILILGSHQYRMHSSSNCKIYLQTGSTPIIEHCSSLVFGESPSFVEKQMSSNNFACVQDFDYPFAGPLSPSPNWRLEAAEEVEWSDLWMTRESRRDHWKELKPHSSLVN